MLMYLLETLVGHVTWRSSTLVIHIWAQGRHFHWMALKMLSTNAAAPWSDPKHCTVSLPSQANRISWKLTNQCPSHKHSWCIRWTMSKCTWLFTALCEEGCGFPCLKMQLRSHTYMNRSRQRGQRAYDLFFHKILLSRSMIYMNCGMERM